MAAVNTAHITFVFTWGKFHLLIFSFLLFHSFLKKLVNIYFPYLPLMIKVFCEGIVRKMW